MLKNELGEKAEFYSIQPQPKVFAVNDFENDLIMVTGAMEIWFCLSVLRHRFMYPMEININALTHNYNFTNQFPNKVVMVKAFAYGVARKSPITSNS